MKYPRTLFSCLVLTLALLALSCGGAVPDALAPDMVLVNGKAVVENDRHNGAGPGQVIRRGK